MVTSHTFLFIELVHTIYIHHKQQSNKEEHIMQQYTEAELSNKIHTFLARKSLKFPEIETVASSSRRKIIVRDRRSSNVFTALENLNSLWAQRIHS